MPASRDPAQGRPSNREVETENQRSSGGANAATVKPPRPATEPRGAEGSSDSPKTRTDPGSGEA